MVKISRFLYLTVVTSLICMIFASCEAGYKNNGKQVTYHYWNEGSGSHVRVIDADPSTFEDLGDKYAHDARHAFLEGYIIEGADGKTFKYLGKCYSIDANHVFHYDSIMPQADPLSFKVHSWYLKEDKKDFYWHGDAIHVSDKETFVLLGDKDDIDTNWAKDKINAYCMGYPPVPLADYKSFHLISSGCYAADKYHVYFEDHIVEGADPESFKEVGYRMGQDKYRVYKGWKVTAIKDFKKLSQIGCFYTDGKHVYTSDFELFEYADPKTFRQIEKSAWYVDKDHVWYDDRLVKEADVSTIQPVCTYTFFSGKKEPYGIDYNYGKDKYHVFFEDSLMQGADPATFEILDIDNDGWTIIDKNRIYEGKNSKALQKYLRDKYGRKQ